MFKALKHKYLYKNIILTIAFSLIMISVSKDIAEIKTSSSENPYITVPIIMYHQVKSKCLGKDVISPSEFENDLKYLTNNNYHTVTMNDLIEYVYNDGELPENPIIISFDDGYLSTYKYVFPLIKQYNVKIVLSIVGKSTDDFTRVHDTNINYAHLTWDEINEMKQSGLVEIQNHSYNMHKICNGRYGCGQKYNESLLHYEEVLTEDVTTFQEKLQQMTDGVSNTFTYPYGKYNENSELIMKKLGFKATLSVQYGVNLINRDPERLYGLKRMCRAHNYSINKLIKDGMETIKHVNK